MPFAVFGLAAINIAIGTQSFVFAGLLSELAQDLGISIGTAGLLVPASSITFAVAAPFATALVSRIERKRVMVASLAILALCNALCAVAPTFGWLLALRILGGVVTAFAGSLATVAVTSLVPAEQRGRAFAIVVGGLTVALVLGVPLGSVVGGHFGWRTTFGYSAAVCALSVLLITVAVPQINPLPGPRAAFAPLLRNSAILRVFGLTILGFAAAFTIVAYLGPIINRLTGVSGAGVGVLQAFIGIGSLVGLAAGGYGRRSPDDTCGADDCIRRDGAGHVRVCMGARTATADDDAAAGRGPDLSARLDHVRSRSDESRPTLAIGRAGGSRRLAALHQERSVGVGRAKVMSAPAGILRGEQTFDFTVEIRYLNTASVFAESGVGVAIVDPPSPLQSERFNLTIRPFEPATQVSASMVHVAEAVLWSGW